MYGGGDERRMARVMVEEMARVMVAEMARVMVAEMARVMVTEMARVMVTETARLMTARLIARAKFAFWRRWDTMVVLKECVSLHAYARGTFVEHTHVFLIVATALPESPLGP